MLLPPPGAVQPIHTVKLVGPIVQWACSLLLVGVFALLIPLTSQRRAVITWMTAWAAQAVSVAGLALTSLFLIFKPGQFIPSWTAAFDPWFRPARFVFLAAVTLGALGAAGWRPSRRVHYGILVGAAALGAACWAAQFDPGKFYLLATLIAVFGVVQVVLYRARGVRRRGQIFLAGALTVFGASSTIYLLSAFVILPRSSFADFVSAFSLSSGYGDAFALALLGAAVIVVTVQEAFIDAAQAHESRILGIAASEVRLNAIIQAAQEAIITVGIDGRIELINSAAEAIFGLGHPAGLGQPLAEFVIDTAQPLLGMIGGGDLTESTSGPGFATYTAQGRRVDGSTFALEFTVGRLRGEGRSGAVVVLHDLTRRNAAQAERAAFERRMADDEKTLAIGRVVSGVAHELNNPLAVVLGQSEQMVELMPAGEVQSGLRLIHEQAQRARHIVKDLLAFVRHREEQREVVDMVRLVERTFAAQLNSATKRGITLLAELPPSLPPTSIDRVAVEQILINLLDNAIDAAGPEGTVRLSARAVDNAVELIVEDDGHGVPDAIAGRIFEPFFTSKDIGQGTGLGLSVSLGLAEQQGGTLRWENRPAPGVGARFILSLPVCAPAAPEASTPGKAPAFPRPPAGGNGAAAEVMLIDDEAGVRATLGKMFKRAGWQVREAADGNKALSWLESVSEDEAPAVILCDLKMPGLGGRALYEQLLERRPWIVSRLIFVTGDVVESVSNGFIASSGREVVEKPFTISEIARAVERTVKQN